MGSEPSEASAVTAISPADTRRWIAKAQLRVDPLRDVIHATGGRSRTVRAHCVSGIREAAYGNFMLSWPVPLGPDVTTLRHLPEGAFFLKLLDLAYQPELAVLPHLRTCLWDGSRLELAFTNDVLQVQAAGPPGPYSMVRHHALVLHAATHWLDEPARSRWLELCAAVAAGLSRDLSGPPSAARLDDIEARAFADLETLAASTIDPVDAAALLAEPGRLANVVEFHRVATAAVAVLDRRWRDRLSRGGRLLDWQAEQIAAAAHDDYLRDDWEQLL
jgi:hypothetical protein